MFFDRVIFDINVLGTGMLAWIARDGYGCAMITIHRLRITWAPRSRKSNTVTYHYYVVISLSAGLPKSRTAALNVFQKQKPSLTDGVAASFPEKKLRYAPPNSSKETYLSIFTPQKQVTPDLYFGPDDILKDKAKALKENTKALKEHAKVPKPITAMTCATTIEKTNSLLAEIKNLKAQIKGKMTCVTMPAEKPKVLAPGMYAIDVESIPPCNRNNREVHLDYVKHLKESVETLYEIVEEATVEKPLDRSLASACLYTKQSQELLEYVIGTCPKDYNNQDKRLDTTPLTRKKQVTFKETCETSTNNT
ncbi:hypothetical protein Tco_1393072 [Tanacetum coccineum]